MPPSTFRRLRKQSGFTFGQIAEHLGLHPRTVQRYAEPKESTGHRPVPRWVGDAMLRLEDLKKNKKGR